jgi:hypothetical protein
VREATHFVRAAEDDLLFHRSGRALFFGTRQSSRRALQHHLVDEADASKVWVSTAMRTAVFMPEFLDPDIALVTASVEKEETPLQRAFEDWKSIDTQFGGLIEDAVRTATPNGLHTTAEWRTRPEFPTRQATS